MRIRVAHISTVDMTLRYILLNQLQSVRSAGFEVMAISAPGPNVPAIEAAGIPHIPVPLTRRFTPLIELKALWILYRVIQREGFAIVHTHTPKAGLLGRLAAKLANVPVIVHTNHGFLSHERSSLLASLFWTTLEKIGAHCSDLIFSNNMEDIETAIRLRICEPTKIMPLGPGGIGIDIDRFNPASMSPEVIVRKRDEIGLKRDGPVVGFVARLVREKGLLEFLAAAYIVCKKIPDTQFLIVGPVDTDRPGALEPDCAASYGVADACYFLGLRHDMPELYALMDVFVLPSHREGFGRVLAEASAMKVPVVATNVRGCRETVEHGHNGLLVPLGDVQALADAIVELLTDREKARRIGQEGRRMALERFDERLVFEKVKTEYARLLQEKGLPVPTTVHTSTFKDANATT